MSQLTAPFPGYFTGHMVFYDGWGNEICRADDLIFLYQFYNGMFGSRYIQAQVTRPGVIKSFLLTVDQLGLTRSGSIGPDLECDIKTPVVPMYPGGVFWTKNFFFGVVPDTPQEVADFIMEMGTVEFPSK